MRATATMDAFKLWCCNDYAAIHVPTVTDKPLYKLLAFGLLHLHLIFYLFCYFVCFDLV